MKPLLIIPPSPPRRAAMEDLYGGAPPALRDDLLRRFAHGVDGAADALAVIADGGRLLAGAAICRCSDVGVLGHVLTRETHRRRGHAAALLRALLDWFDATGGRRVYAGSSSPAAMGLFVKHGFAPLHEVAAGERTGTMMRRSAAGDGGNPFASIKVPDSAPAGHGSAPSDHGAAPADRSSSPVDHPSVPTGHAAAPTGHAAAPADHAAVAADHAPVIRNVTRADWPALVELHQYFAGGDPRIPQAESAVWADLAMLEWLDAQDRGACHLLAALQRGRIVAFASIATDPPPGRTIAMLAPHDAAPALLRQAAVGYGRSRGYPQVDFPMEALRP